MESLLFFVFVGIPISIIGTLIRVGLHAANGFKNFRQVQAGIGMAGSFIGDFCTFVVVPLLYIVVSWDGTAFGSQIVQFIGGQQYFWVLWIIAYTGAYTYAIFETEPQRPLVEVLVNLLLGVGIGINLLIAWPLIFHETIWLALIGNLPILIALLITLNRRHVLLRNNTQSALDQERYDNLEVLDYLPDEKSRIESYDYSGELGGLLRQHLAVKMLVFCAGGGILLVGSALIARQLGMEIFTAVQ